MSKKDNVSNLSDKEKITRKEFTDILTQIFDNMSTMSNSLMSDMNTMFQKYTYPTLMRLEALVDVLVDKGVLTRDEVAAKAAELLQEAIKAAKPTNAEGKELSPDEVKELYSKNVESVQNENNK